MVGLRFFYGVFLDFAKNLLTSRNCYGNIWIKLEGGTGVKEEKNKIERREMFVNENTNIVQSNFLIERKHKLSLAATLLMFTITGMINKDDDDLKEYKVDVSEFAKLWKKDTKNAYDEIIKALSELRKGGIDETFYDPESEKKRFVSVGFISKAEYVEGEGYCLVNIDPVLKPHYIQLKNNFTKFKFENLVRLNEARASGTQVRIYELLKQYQKVGWREFTITELKNYLGLIEYDSSGRIKKEKYKGNNSDLKNKLLEPCKKTINECTDIYIEYEFKGRGKSAIVRFTIQPNNIFNNKPIKEDVPEPKAPVGKIKVTDENGNEYYLDPNMLQKAPNENIEIDFTDVSDEKDEIDIAFIPACMELVKILPKDFGNDLQQVNVVRTVIYEKIKDIPDFKERLDEDETSIIVETAKVYIDREWAFDKKKQKTGSTAAFFTKCLGSWLEETFSADKIKAKPKASKGTSNIGKNSVLDWAKKYSEQE